jgi:hypothetical protein
MNTIQKTEFEIFTCSNTDKNLSETQKMEIVNKLESLLLINSETINFLHFNYSNVSECLTVKIHSETQKTIIQNIKKLNLVDIDICFTQKLITIKREVQFHCLSSLDTFLNY